MRLVDRLPHVALSLEALSQPPLCARRGRRAPHPRRPRRVCSPDSRFSRRFREAGYTHPQIVTSTLQNRYSHTMGVSRRRFLKPRAWHWRFRRFTTPKSSPLQPSSTRPECFQSVFRTARCTRSDFFFCESFRRPFSKSTWAARMGRFSKGLMRGPEKSWRALFRTAPPATACG
jgi:hypothetical protein